MCPQIWSESERERKEERGRERKKGKPTTSCLKGFSAKQSNKIGSIRKAPVKAKWNSIKVEQVKRTLFTTIATGERDRTHMSSILLKQNAGQFLRDEVKEIIGHLCLLIGLIHRKPNFLLSSRQDVVTTQNKRPTLLWRLGARSAVFIDDYISKR